MDKGYRQSEQKSCGFHRITEWLGLKETLEGHPVPNPHHKQGPPTPHWTTLLKAPSNTLNTSSDRASTGSLGKLFQHLIMPRVKNFLLVSNLNVPSISLKPLPLVLSLPDHVFWEGCAVLPDYMNQDTSTQHISNRASPSYDANKMTSLLLLQTT